MHDIRNKRKAQSGFTLIELIVVIVIVGILAAVAIPRFSDTTASATAAARAATLAALKTAWATEYAKGTPPAPPLVTAVAAAMDPACTATGRNISCPSAGADFVVTGSGTTIAAASDITAP